MILNSVEAFWIDVLVELKLVLNVLFFYFLVVSLNYVPFFVVVKGYCFKRQEINHKP